MNTALRSRGYQSVMSRSSRPTNGKSLRLHNRTEAQELAERYVGKRLWGPACVKYWEIIAGNLSRVGWSWGCVSAVDFRGRTIFIADAHRDDAERFIVRADEKLIAFVELESAIRVSDKTLQRY